MTRTTRLIGFDLIRLISFFIVSFYHYLYAVWRARVPEFNATMATEPIFWNGMYPALRSLSFSGHTLLFMSALLIALSQKRLTQVLRLAVFLFIAWTTFVLVEVGFTHFEFYWDVHALLLIGLVSIACAEKISPQGALSLGVFGFFMTLFPFWKVAALQALPVELRAPVIGDCEIHSSSWPILPWLGFLWAGYALGIWLRDQKLRERLSRIQKNEAFAWGLVCFASLFWLGGYYKLDALDEWECFAFKLPALEFWAHLLWVLLAIRLSFVTSINDWLAEKVPWLQKLHVSKNFFLAYALQYVLAFLIVDAFGHTLRTRPLAFTIVGFMMLPAAELVARLGAKLGGRKAVKGS